MPDITMCTGGQLPQCGKCYRRTTKPSMYQSYFATPPDKSFPNEHGCAYYWALPGNAPRRKDKHDGS